MEVIAHFICICANLFAATVFLISAARGMRTKRPYVSSASAETISITALLASSAIQTAIRVAHLPAATRPFPLPVAVGLVLVSLVPLGLALPQLRSYAIHGATTAGATRATEHAFRELGIPHEQTRSEILIPGEGVTIRLVGPFANGITLLTTKGKAGRQRLRQVALRMGEYFEDHDERLVPRGNVARVIVGTIALLSAAVPAVFLWELISR